MEAVVADRAETVAEAARAGAPVRRGTYRAGITSRTVETRDGFMGQVVATHFTSRWIELGTINQPAQAPLRRALEAVFGNQIGEIPQ